MAAHVTLEALPPADLIGVPFSTLLEGDRELVPEACRVLILTAEPGSLCTASRSSYLLHDIERHDGATRELSSLYNGICQIGLGRTELGIKRVASALRAAEDCPGDVSPV